LLIAKRIIVDDYVAKDMNQQVTQFSKIHIDGEFLQNNSPVYVMLNKPKGIVCATKDQRHTTVLDLIHDSLKSELHIVGRLDFNSTGLVLLTNDGNWSRRLSSPLHGVTKRYLGTLENPLTQENCEVFARGMYFSYEDITTRPCILRIISEFKAEIELAEGRYHQIKRMFGVFQNKVLDLHRYGVGNLTLDSALIEGESRRLSEQESIHIFDNTST